MPTFVIILITLLILIALVRGMCNEQDDLQPFFFVTILFVLFLGIGCIIAVNQPTVVHKSTAKVNPKLEITTKIDGNTVKSDTTYIYTFKNE